MVWAFFVVYLSVGCLFGAEWLKVLGSDVMGSLRKMHTDVLKTGVASNWQRQSIEEMGGDVDEFDKGVSRMMAVLFAVGAVWHSVLWLPLIVTGNICVHAKNGRFVVRFK